MAIKVVVEGTILTGPIARFGDQLVLPRTFVAHIDDPRNPYTLDLDVEVVAGFPRCAALKATARSVKAEPVRLPLDGRLEGYLLLAAKAIAGKVESSDGAFTSFTEATWVEAEERAKDAWRSGRPSRRRRLSDAHYEEVALVYRSATAPGVSPRRAVAEYFAAAWGRKEIPIDTVAKWIGEARRRGKLGPTRSGQKGEIRTS